jgi:hypothetical protein
MNYEYSNLVRTPQGWEDNIKIGLRKMWCESEDWIQLAQDKVQWQEFVSTEINILLLKSGIHLDQFSDYQILKKHPTQRN